MIPLFGKKAPPEPAPIPPLILIVCDDPVTCTQVEQALPSDRYRVLKAMNITEGLTVLDREIPVLVIGDFIDPAGVGRDFLERARIRVGKAHTPPVLLLSDSLEDEVMARAMDVGALLQKPFTMDTLVRLVDELVAARAA